jgi:thioredoxin reductase (NADPH)
LQNRARENPKIKFMLNTVATEVIGEDAVTAVRLRSLVSGEEFDYPADGLFIFIGHDPNTQLFQGQLELDDRGYMKVDHLMRTNIPGVFVAGEAGDPNYRQVVTSAGMGAAAAMQAGHYLDEHVGYAA